MLTVSDFVNLIQYYYTHASVEDALQDIEKFEIGHLRDVEKKLGAPAPQLISMHPMSSLYDACRLLAESRAHRVPLLDNDALGTEMIISVITQYRILKFIAVNVSYLLIYAWYKENKEVREVRENKGTSYSCGLSFLLLLLLVSRNAFITSISS